MFVMIQISLMQNRRILIPLWRRHQMETFSALLTLCAGNSPVTGEFPSQRIVTQSFDVFFGLRLKKRLSKQSRGWWFETPSRYYVTVMFAFGIFPSIRNRPHSVFHIYRNIFSQRHHIFSRPICRHMNSNAMDAVECVVVYYYCSSESILVFFLQFHFVLNVLKLL